MGGEAQHGSKLFHAIVMVGAAFGAACGGATETTGSSPSAEASDDAPSDGPLEVEGEVGPDAVADGPSADVSDAGGNDGALDAPPGALDGDICTQPGSNARPCGTGPRGGINCCVSGGCFPCFV